MTVSRRRFLKYSGIGGAMVFTGGVLAACGETTTAPNSSSASVTSGAGITPMGAVASPPAPAQSLNYTALDPKNLANFSRPLLLPGQNGLLAVLDVTGSQAFEVTAKPTTLEIFKGKSTDLQTYQVTMNGKTIVNPIFRAKVGANFTANLTNNLGEDTTIHWHGLKVDWRMDGHPSMPVKNGSSYRYNFAVQNRGGTYWYHPHPDKLTAKQAYMGLASFYLVEDADSTRLNDQLDLKFGETDLPIVIQDKQFDTSGKLVYDTNSNTQFMGFYGDTILANLTPNAHLDVDTRIYRLRLLNGSNARNYRLAFVNSNNSNQKLAYWLIGTDGGLLDKPYQTNEVFLSPGERIEVLLDLSKFEAGEVVALKSMAFDPMHHEMDMMGGSSSNNGSGMGGMSGMGSSNTQSVTNSMQTGRLDDGQEFFILKLNVKNKVSYTRAIPPTLSTLTSPDISQAPTVRPFVLSQAMMQSSGQMMQWLINSKSFKMDEYPISVKQASTEVWEFRNETQSMPHPMHLHGFQFQVIERLNSPSQLQGLNKYDKGRLATDLGWKDTVLIWPGETVRVALNFTHNFRGEQTYVVHCHVLEHEENGMMLNYKVIEG